MNNAKRKKLYDAIQLLTKAATMIDELLHEEEMYLDNLPEARKETERFDNAQETIKQLEDAELEIENLAEILSDDIVAPYISEKTLEELR